MSIYAAGDVNINTIDMYIYIYIYNDNLFEINKYNYD